MSIDLEAGRKPATPSVASTGAQGERNITASLSDAATVEGHSNTTTDHDDDDNNNNGRRTATSASDSADEPPSTTAMEKVPTAQDAAGAAAGFSGVATAPTAAAVDVDAAANAAVITAVNTATGRSVTWEWHADPANPYNWSKSRKWAQVGCVGAMAFAASINSSIMSPAHATLMREFNVGSTAAILPLTMYVLALGIGPVVIGGPLSETVGRYIIFALSTPCGVLFTIGAALCPTSSLGGLCVLRFLAGFALSPSISISAGVLTEIFLPADRGPPVAIFILTPFLGPGMGPVLGAFAMRKGWRWTQWTAALFAGVTLVFFYIFGRETYHPVVKRRRARELGLTLPPEELPPVMPWTRHLSDFLTVGLIRPLHMFLREPIVGLTCLYVACEFATLFSFFAAVPYVFGVVYGFGPEQSGLVFLSIVVGCMLSVVTVVACDIFFYRKRQMPRHHPNPPPPEHRLYAAMIGSVGLPAGLFWFGWSAFATHGGAAHRHVSWVSPVLAIVPFAWGNLSIFISLFQYMGDTYNGSLVASAASANCLVRYLLAGVFPLFILQMYGRLGIGWASSLLGFIAVGLLPVPWLFFRFGPSIRARSRYIK
ncbi:major facilitator superfamily transporter [Niveomyces insectorum RCEF 264]|uniref:Major facilitator superfamily transporter n=1 Tax=Niveomyces insectorum RCEF 264 TaxID=1081102 RepID=A0A167QS21_9HYPO|nr:major facilitator superfamily transporter [Niveomyces insectorum RCEF 264]